MRRHGKLINVCLALLCIVLVLILGGLVVWNRNQTREDKQRLEKLADETRAEDREDLQKLDKKQEETAKELQHKAAQEAEVTATPAPTLSPVPSEPVKEKNSRDILLGRRSADCRGYTAVFLYDSSSETSSGKRL